MTRSIHKKRRTDPKTAYRIMCVAQAVRCVYFGGAHKSHNLATRCHRSSAPARRLRHRTYDDACTGGIVGNHFLCKRSDVLVHSSRAVG